MIPQSVHICPLLFVIFTTDISTCFSYCDYLLFEDDLKLFANVSSIDDCYLIKKDLGYLYDWCLDNGLKLNTSECLKLSYTRSRTKINRYYYIILDDKIGRRKYHSRSRSYFTVEHFIFLSY